MRSLPRVVALAILAVAACTPAGSTPSPSPSLNTAGPSASGTRLPVSSGLATAPHAIVGPVRAWYLVPDGLTRDTVHIAVTFPDGDPSAGTPRARLRSNGRVVALERSRDIPASWQAELPLDGVTPGDQRVEVIVRLTSGQDEVIGQRDFKASAPEYIVWTLDFEGDAAGDEELANTAAIADGLRVAMTVMWNPRVWTTTQVSAGRADTMLAWTKARAAKGDEVALHLHAWTDYVRDAGVTPRTAPNWAGRSDGYDVPLTAFDESETRKLLDRALELMSAHGMAKPTSFRGGGLFGNAANLRAVAAAGFSVDASSTPAGVFGRLPLPWTLAKDAQPYRPSSTDANVVGDLPLLEVPNIAGNTYGLTVNTIVSTTRDDLGMLAPVGQAAATRRVLTLVSHPGTIDPTERAAIEALFKAFGPLRYDADSGPVRFVTLAQVAQAYR
ncbi:MAG TPA: hypothetical protein VEP48_09630 [Methylomirabilota bacterium]|nr:hypothetical protein [Methylomirabilota bacterium]